MNRYLSPWSVYWAVDDAVDRAVYWPVFRAVDLDVRRAVWGAVEGAVWRDVGEAVLVSPPHPNLDLLAKKVRHTRAQGGAL